MSAPVYHFDQYRLSPATREFRCDGRLVAVPARVFDCIAYLIENRTRAVGRDELGAAIWGRSDVSEAQLTQTILRARRLLGDASAELGYIRTVPRFGYHWIGQVEVESGDHPPAVWVPEPGATAESAVPVPSPATPMPAAATRSRTRRTRVAVTALLVLLAVAVAGVVAFVALPRTEPSTPPAELAAPGGAVVLPIDVQADPDHAWVRLGAIDVIANRLRAAGLAVPPTESTLALIGQRGTDDHPALLRDTATHWVVAGSAARSARGWRVVLQADDARGNRLTASSETYDLLQAIGDGTGLLLRQMGRTPAALSSRDPAVEEALRRAQAAMLENDFDAAQRILTGALTSAADQPELRFQLATLAFRAGQLDEARKQLQSLLDERSSDADAQRRSQIHYLLGAIAMMRDRAAEAEPEFETALSTLDRRRHPLDYGKALGGRGGARLTLGRAREGLDDLGEARTLLEQGGDRLALARLNLAFGIALLRLNRPAQAVPVLTSALAQLEPFGAIDERVHGYSALCNAQLELLDYAMARQSNETGLALLTRASDPFKRSETLLDRVAIQLAAGQAGAAAPLFAELDAIDLREHAAFDGRRDSLHAIAAWQRGDAMQTQARAGDAFGKLLPTEPDAAASVRLLGIRALLALERRADAARLLASDAPRSGSAAAVDAALARAELAVAGADWSAADAEFTSAWTQAQSLDVPAVNLRVATAMVPYLLAQGQADAAGAIVGRVTPAAGQDFDAALLRVRVHHAMGRVQAWADALSDARRLAGERAIPIELRTAPAAALPQPAS
jgi:DNA-binding winged helix-turn-helix (wHTH) protein/tetratricopeptide (TPR) repeat protein